MANVAQLPEVTGSDADDRARALAAWRDRFDPENKLDPEALPGAAAIAALVPGGHGRQFEPEAFGDLVEFIAEMPF